MSLKNTIFFFKGLVSYVALDKQKSNMSVNPRHAGTASYSQLFGSIPLALNGIYCYSNVPLQILSLAGFFLFDFLLQRSFYNNA